MRSAQAAQVVHGVYRALLGGSPRFLEQELPAAGRGARGRCHSRGHLGHLGPGLQIALARVERSTPRDRTQQPGGVQHVGQAVLLVPLVAHRVGEHRWDAESIAEGQGVRGQPHRSCAQAGQTVGDGLQSKAVARDLPPRDEQPFREVALRPAYVRASEAGPRSATTSWPRRSCSAPRRRPEGR